MWETRAGVQVSKREFHTHIYLDYSRVKFYLINKKKSAHIYDNTKTLDILSPNEIARPKSNVYI